LDIFFSSSTLRCTDCRPALKKGKGGGNGKGITLSIAENVAVFRASKEKERKKMSAPCFSYL